MMIGIRKKDNRELRLSRIILNFKKNWQLYLMLLLPVVYLIIFKIAPMYGIQIVFKDYSPGKGILKSPWSQPLFKYFIKFFTNYNFWRIIKNTLGLSIYGLIAGFPVPIILAIALHYSQNLKVKKVIQMLTYAPHFISVVVIVGMINQLFEMNGGIVNQIVVALGGEKFDFIGSPGAFPHLFVWSGIWQNMGFNSVIYISALVGVDQSLHEAAVVDGATKMQRIRHIDLPSMAPTIVTLLILNCGQILNVSFEKVLLMQNNVNVSTSEVISTYVYKMAFVSSIPQFSYSTAVGLFQGIIGLVLIFSVNKIADRVSNSALF